MDYVDFGQQVRKRRLKLGMTQEELAEKCNCSNSHIGKIECGKGGFSIDMLVDIANALRTTVDQLLSHSYDYEEILFLREISERISKLPLNTRIRGCEMLQGLLDIIEKSQE